MSDKVQGTEVKVVMPGVGRGGKSSYWLIGGLGLFALVAIGLGSPSLLLFMLIGFSPTLVAFIIDRNPDKHSAIAVGAMSLAAMIPLVLTQLTARSGTGYNVLGDTFAWLRVFGCATVGWFIHIGVPAISVIISDARTRWRQEELRKLQAALVEEWGSEIITGKKAK